MSRAGAVVALPVEARTLGPRTRRTDGLWELRDGTLLAVGGMGGGAALAAAAALVDAGATALVSWGMAGGLDPALPAGTLCLPAAVLTAGGERLETDLHWREILSAAIAPHCAVAGGLLLTVDAPIDDAAGKAAAFAAAGAVAVDMESFSVAQVAAARRVPFVAVRAILDTAADSLPGAVLRATRRGRVRWPALLWGLCRAPADLASLLRLARRYRRARQALLAVARTGALAPLALGAPHVSRIA